MKRIPFILASVACALAGCTLEPAEGLFNSDAPVFTASFADGGATRTQLADNQTSVLWSDGDEISVFDGNRANHEYLSSGPGKVTEFSLKGSGTVEPASTWYALYPYDPDAQRSPHTNELWTILKSEYTQSRAGTFAEGMNLAIAQTDDASLNLSFKNVMGYIAVAVKGASDVTALTFRGNNEDGVAGPISIPFDLTAIHFSGRAGISVSKTLTLQIQNFEESASREAAKYYYIPVLPGYAFQKGFSIDVTKGDGVHTYTYDNAVTFNRGEKRSLFIEIPNENNYIDLVNEPLQWTTQLKDVDPVNWDEKHRLYPNTHADLAYAEWTWNNFPEPLDYPEGTPTLDIYKKRVRVYYGMYDNDALVFTVPVKEIPASKKLVFTFGLRGGGQMAAYWTAEACLDGTNWIEMSVVGQKEGSTYKDFAGRDGNNYTAPIFMTDKDNDHVFQATTTVSETLSNQVIQLRLRVLLFRPYGNNTPLTLKQCHNTHCWIAFVLFTLNGVSYSGPNISVQ